MGLLKYADLDKIRMGYVLAYESENSFFSRQIVRTQLKAGFTEEQAKFTHVEVSGGRVHSVLIAPPLSRVIDITKTHYGRYVKVLRYKNDDYEKKGRYKVAYFSATLANLPYDIAGVLGFLYKWIKDSNRLYFCSEGVLVSFQKVFPEVLHYMPPPKCMPAHFVSSDQFEVVWEGNI